MTTTSYAETVYLPPIVFPVGAARWRHPSMRFGYWGVGGVTGFFALCLILALFSADDKGDTGWHSHGMPMLAGVMAGGALLLSVVIMCGVLRGFDADIYQAWYEEMTTVTGPIGQEQARWLANVWQMRAYDWVTTPERGSSGRLVVETEIDGESLLISVEAANVRIVVVDGNPGLRSAGMRHNLPRDPRGPGVLARARRGELNQCEVYPFHKVQLHIRPEHHLAVSSLPA